MMKAYREVCAAYFTLARSCNSLYHFGNYTSLIVKVRSSHTSSLLPPHSVSPLNISSNSREAGTNSAFSVTHSDAGSSVEAQELHCSLVNMVQSVLRQKQEKKTTGIGLRHKNQVTSRSTEDEKKEVASGGSIPHVPLPSLTVVKNSDSQEVGKTSALSSQVESSKTEDNVVSNTSSVENPSGSSSLSSSPTDLLRRLLLHRRHQRSREQRVPRASFRSQEKDRIRIVEKASSTASEVINVASCSSSLKPSHVAFHMFSEAIQKSGVTPTTQHFNLLLLLAILDGDWNQVDLVERVHLGLLMAVAEKQDNHLYAPKQNREIQERSLERAREVDGQRIEEEEEEEEHRGNISASRSTWFSLAVLEESMSPNAVTFDLLMEAQLKRAYSVLYSVNLKSDTSNSQSHSPQLLRNDKILEGAAWAVLDLLDDRQAKGIPLTESGLLYVMEALTILMRVGGANDEGLSISTGTSETLKSARQRYDGAGRTEGRSQSEAIREAAVREGLIRDYPHTSEAEEVKGGGVKNARFFDRSSSLATPSWRESDDPIWEAAYTLYNSYYAQPRPSHQFQTSSFFYTNPYDYFYNHSNGEMMDEEDRWVCGSAAIPGLVPSSFSERGRRYSTPPSVYILFNLLKLLRAGGQHNLAVEVYEEYERREVFQRSKDRGWWWRENGAGSTSTNLGGDTALLSWEQLGVFPTKNYYKTFLTDRTTKGNSSLLTSSHYSNGVRHIGWEVWLMVSECAKELGDWKVALRIWQSAYTTAIAASAAGVAFRENRRFASSSWLTSLSLFVGEQQQQEHLEDGMGSMIAESGNSFVARLDLSVVPQWMRKYLPNILQNALHTLRRVRRYKEVVHFFQTLVHDQKPSAHQQWFWTPFSLLLVSQAAMATVQLDQLHHLCCGVVPTEVEANCTTGFILFKENLLSRSVLAAHDSSLASEGLSTLYATLPSEAFEMTLRMIHFRNCSIKSAVSPEDDQTKEKLSVWSNEVYQSFLKQMLSSLSSPDKNAQNSSNATFPQALSRLWNNFMKVQFLIRGHTSMHNYNPFISHRVGHEQLSADELSESEKKCHNLLLILHDIENILQSTAISALSILLICDTLYSVREFVVSMFVPDAVTSAHPLSAALSAVEQLSTSMLINLCGDSDEVHPSHGKEDVWSSTAIHFASRALLLCSTQYTNAPSSVPKRKAVSFPPHVISALAVLKKAEELNWLSKKQLTTLYAMVQKAREYEISHLYHQLVIEHEEAVEGNGVVAKRRSLSNLLGSSLPVSSGTHGERLKAVSIATVSSPALLNVAMKLMASLNATSASEGKVSEIKRKLYAERKSLFAQLFHTLSMQTATIFSSRELVDTEEKVMSISILIREIISSVVEKVSLDAGIREDHGADCVELLAIFLPIHEDHLWYLPSHSLNGKESRLYADVKTMEAVRRLLRFCKNADTALIETLANQWLRITDNWHQVDVHEKNSDLRTPFCVPEQVVVTELALDVVVWSSRHRIKPLLLSCMAWFKSVLPHCLDGKYFPSRTNMHITDEVIHREQQKHEQQKMFEMGLDSAVIACQSLSSGPHEDVLRNSYQHLAFLLKDIIFPVLHYKVEMHNDKDETSDLSNATLLNLLDNSVAVLNKLQKTFHSLIVQVSLDIYRWSVEDNVLENSMKTSRRKHLFDLLKKIKPAAASYLHISEIYTLIAVDMVRKINFHESGFSVSQSSFKTMRHILSTLIDGQWDIHFASFVKDHLFVSKSVFDVVEDETFVELPCFSYTSLRQRLHRLLWVEKHFLTSEEQRYTLHMQQWAIMMGHACTAKEVASDIAALLDHDSHPFHDREMKAHVLHEDGAGFTAHSSKKNVRKDRKKLSSELKYRFICPPSIFLSSVELFTERLTQPSWVDHQDHRTITTIRSGDPLPPLRGTGDSPPIACFANPVVFLAAIYGKQCEERTKSNNKDNKDMLQNEKRVLKTRQTEPQSVNDDLTMVLSVLQEASVRVLYFHLAEVEVDISVAYQHHRVTSGMIQNSVTGSGSQMVFLWHKLLMRMLAWPCPSNIYSHFADAVLLNISVLATEKGTPVYNMAACCSVSPRQLESMMRTILHESIALSVFRESLVNSAVHVTQSNDKKVNLHFFFHNNLVHLWSLFLNAEVGRSSNDNGSDDISSESSTVVSSASASQVLLKEELIHLLFKALSFYHVRLEIFSRFSIGLGGIEATKTQTHSRDTKLFLWRIFAAFPSVTGKALRDSLRNSTKVGSARETLSAVISGRFLLSTQIHGITLFFDDVLNMHVHHKSLSNQNENENRRISDVCAPPLSLVRSAVSWLLMVHGSLSPSTPFGFVPSVHWNTKKSVDGPGTHLNESSAVLISDEITFATLMTSYKKASRKRTNDSECSFFFRSLIPSITRRASSHWWGIGELANYNVYNCFLTPSFLPRQLAKEILHNIFSKAQSTTAMCQYFSEFALEKLLVHAHLLGKEAEVMREENRRRRAKVLQCRESLSDKNSPHIIFFLENLAECLLRADDKSQSSTLILRRADIVRAILGYPKENSSSNSFLCFSSSSSWREIFQQLEKLMTGLRNKSEFCDFRSSSMEVKEELFQGLNSVTVEVIYRALILILEDILWRPFIHGDGRKKGSAQIAVIDERVYLICSLLMMIESVSRNGYLSEQPKPPLSLSGLFVRDYLMPWLHHHYIFYNKEPMNSCKEKESTGEDGGRYSFDERWENFLFTLISSVLSHIHIFQWGNLVSFKSRSEFYDGSIALLRSLCLHVALTEMALEQHLLSQVDLVQRKENISLMWNYLRQYYRDYTTTRIPADLIKHETSAYQGFWLSSSISFRCWNQTGLILGMWREMERVGKFLCSVTKTSRNKPDSSSTSNLWWKGSLFVSVLITKSVLRAISLDSKAIVSFLPVFNLDDEAGNLPEEQQWNAIRANALNIRELIELASAERGSENAHTDVQEMKETRKMNGSLERRKGSTISFVHRLWRCEPLKLLLQILNSNTDNDNGPGPITLSPLLFEGLVQMSCVGSDINIVSFDVKTPSEDHGSKIQQAVEHLLRATAEEFDLLRRSESSFQNVASTSSLPRISLSWRTVQSNLSMIPPKTLKSLLLVIASPKSSPVPGNVKSNHLPLPHTVHFIPPQWSSAAVGACERWSDALSLLHASLSTLRRTGEQATAVQHLMMQVMLKRLRDESNFRRGVSSFSFSLSEESTDVEVGKQDLLLLSVLRASQPSNNKESYPVNVIEGTVAIALHCYLCCCGAHNMSIFSQILPKITSIPRIPQRLMVEILRTCVHSPHLCLGFYQIFLHQSYLRLEGVHPFLSLLRASKNFFHTHNTTEEQPGVLVNIPASQDEMSSTIHYGKLEALAFIVLAMDGYHCAVTGSALLQQLFKSLFEKSQERAALIHAYLEEKTQWYMSFLKVGEVRESKRDLFSSSQISLNGQRMMWKAFADVCRFLAANKTKLSAEEREVFFIVITLLSEEFKANGLISDVEEEMVKVQLFSLNCECPS